MEKLRATPLRDEARVALTGNWHNGALVSFVAMVIVGVASAIPFLGYAAAILTGPITIGLMFVFLDLLREKKQPAVGDIFALFQEYTRYLMAYVLVYIYTLLWTLLFVVPGIIKSLSYSMTYYIMKDNPEITPSEAINQSMAMMEGHKMELFLLQLSFIGWFILGLLAFGIGLFWVIPYQYTAIAAFYEKVKGGVVEPVAPVAA